MDNKQPEYGIEELQQLDRWLRPLVRGLVQESEVDDVLQATWVAALEAPPRDPQARPGWLRRVAQNFALGTRRERRRRRDLQQQAVAMAKHSSVPSTEETVQRMAMQRELSAAVSDLPEPYRTAVLQRYLLERSVAEIAETTGTSAQNVRQRVSRGLDLLRAQLRRRHGRDWRHAVLPLAFGPQVPVAMPVLPPLSTPLTPALPLGSGTMLGAIWMKKKVLLAGCVLGGLGLGLLWWNPASGVTEGNPAPDPAAEHLRVGADQPAAPSEGAGSRQVVEGKRPAQARPEAKAPILRGQLLDPRGRALSGIGVGFMTPPDMVDAMRAMGLKAPAIRPEIVTRSAADGSFALAELRGSRFAVDASHVLLRSSPLTRKSPSDGEPCLLVASRSVVVEGQVLDETGRRLKGVRVEPQMLPLAEFPRPLDGTLRHRLSGQELEDGSFHLSGLPAGLCSLTFSRTGYRSQVVVVESQDMRAVRVELKPYPPGNYLLQGRVLDQEGGGVAGALVGLGGVQVRSGADGAFDLELALPLRGRKSPVLFASKPGLQTVVRSDVLEQLLAREGAQRREDPLRVELRLGGPTLSIKGVVKGASGWPRSGVRIALVEEPVIHQQMTAEDLALRGLGTATPSGRSGQMAADETGFLGGFEIRGLAERSYRLRVFDNKSCWSTITAPIRAGSQRVRIQIPKDWARPLVSGRLIDLAGRPLPGQRISCSALVESWNGNTSWTGHRVGETDAEGRFKLVGVVPASKVRLNFGSGRYVRNSVHLEPGDLSTDLVVEVVERCRFRVDVSADPRKPAEILLVDAQGRRLGIMDRSPNRSSVGDRLKLRDGRSEILLSDPAAREAVFLDAEGRELFRKPVRLQPDVVTLISG